jgi:hypothetical protein
MCVKETPPLTLPCLSADGFGGENVSSDFGLEDEYDKEISRLACLKATSYCDQSFRQ